MQSVPADSAEAHPSVTETATHLWNGLPSLWKTLIPAIGALLVVLVPASLYIGSRIDSVTTDNLRAQQEATLTALGATFNEFLNKHTTYLSDFAASDAIKACAPTGCHDQAQDLFGAELARKIQDPSGYFTELGYIDNTGSESARAVRGSGNVATIPTTPASFNVTPLASLSDGQVYIFPISRDSRLAATETYQTPALRLAAPVILPADGQRHGYVTVVLNLDDLFAQNFVFSNQRLTFLLDSQGCLLASSDDSQRPEFYKTWNGDPSRNCFRDLPLQDWDTAVQRYQDTVISTKALHGVLSDSGQTWTLVVQQPVALVYAQANNLNTLLRLAYLITILVVGAVIITADRASVRLIKAAQARSVAHARDSRFNPYVISGPVEDRHLFFGRTEALARVMGVGVMGSDDVLITGDRYIGKTSLLRQVERRLHERRVSDPTYWYWPVSLNLQGVSIDTFYAVVMDRILRDLENSSQQLPVHYSAGQANYGVEEFCEDITRVLDLPNPGDRQTRIVLCLDNIHLWLSHDTTLTFLATFRNALTSIGSQLKLIATGTRIPESAFDRTVSIVTLGPLTTEEAERLVRQPVAEYYHYSDDALAHLLEYSNRLPLEVQRLAHYTVQTMLETDAAQAGLVHVERALQHAIDDHEPIFRLFWHGGTDRAGHHIARLGDEVRSSLIELSAGDAPIPSALYSGEPPLLSPAFLDEISYTDLDGNLRLTRIFKAWLARGTR